MSAYKIYGDAISGNCLKVKWTADYLALDYQWIETSVLRGETRTENFLARNRAGQVPVLAAPGGAYIAQSNAIILFLAEHHGGELIPGDPLRRAKMYEWLFWEQYSHEPYIAVRRFHKTYLGKSDDDIDPKLMARGLDALSLMERQLENGVWICGDDFALADIALLGYTRFADEGGFDLLAFPAVRNWVFAASDFLKLGARDVSL